MLVCENKISTERTPDNNHTLQAVIDGPDVNLYADGALIGWLDGLRGVLVLSKTNRPDNYGIRTTKKGFIKVVRLCE